MHRLILLLFALLLSGCASTPATKGNLADLLPGTWAITTEINGARIEAQTVISANGQVEERVRVTQNGVVSNLTARGSWKVQDDSMVTTYTESSAPDFAPVGSVSRDKVTFIDENQLSVVDEEGTAGTMHRVR